MDPTLEKIMGERFKAKKKLNFALSKLVPLPTTTLTFLRPDSFAAGKKEGNGENKLNFHFFVNLFLFDCL